MDSPTARGSVSLIREGWDVVDLGGRKIGTVTEVHREFIVVRQGRFLKKTSHIDVEDLAGVDAAHCSVRVSVSTTASS